jgi:hypothetical protein
MTISLVRGILIGIVLAITSFILGVIAMKVYCIENQQIPKLENLQVRILILTEKMLIGESGSATHERWNEGMKELAEIGKPAVPKLIEVIETAKGRASAKIYSEEIPPSEFGINVETYTIQTRAVMVLGKIRDAKALPLLLKLQDSNPQFQLKDEIIEAVKNIEKSNNQ